MGLRTLLLCCAALVAPLLGGTAIGDDSPPGPGRAIVTDLKGQALANQRPLKLLSVCYNGDEIEVAAGGQLTLVLTQPLYEYVVTGPATLQLSQDGLVLVSGKPLQQRDLFPGRALQLEEGLIEQASTRTRGGASSADFRNLHPNGTLVDQTPAFQWEAAELTGPVSFTLYDTQATPVYTQTDAEPGFRLPSSVQLRAQHYTWIVSGRRVDGQAVRAQGNFIVADAAQLTWRRQLGDCAQPVSKQVACALLLEQAGFRGDAARYWNAFTQAVPNHSSIRAYQTIEP